MLVFAYFTALAHSSATNLTFPPYLTTAGTHDLTIGKKHHFGDFFIFSENLHARLSNKKKFARKDPETKKWQPLEVEAKSAKIPPGPAGTPPTVERCNFGRFWPIPPPLQEAAISSKMGLSY